MDSTVLALWGQVITTSCVLLGNESHRVIVVILIVPLNSNVEASVLFVVQPVSKKESHLCLMSSHLNFVFAVY